MTPEQATALMAPLSGAELQSLAAEVGRADRKSIAKAIGIGRATLTSIIGSAVGVRMATGETNMKIRVWLASRSRPHDDQCGCDDCVGRSRNLHGLAAKKASDV